MAGCGQRSATFALVILLACSTPGSEPHPDAGQPSASIEGGFVQAFVQDGAIALHMPGLNASLGADLKCDGSPAAGSATAARQTEGRIEEDHGVFQSWLSEQSQGIEQGFLINEAPCDSPEEITIQVQVGDLVPEQDGENIAFRTDEGTLRGPLRRRRPRHPARRNVASGEWARRDRDPDTSRRVSCCCGSHLSMGAAHGVRRYRASRRNIGGS